MSLESSFVHAVLCCSLPCPLSPWEAFDLLSFYRIVIVYRFIVSLSKYRSFFGSIYIYICFIERYIESFGTISNTNTRTKQGTGFTAVYALFEKNCLLRCSVGYYDVVRALSWYGTLSPCTYRYHTCTATTAPLLPAVFVPKIQQQQSFLSLYRSEDIKLFPGT